MVTELEPLPNYGDHMLMERFIELCSNGMFIDSDGSANYATSNEITNLAVYPSDVVKFDFIPLFEYVVWFNK